MIFFDVHKTFSFTVFLIVCFFTITDLSAQLSRKHYLPPFHSTLFTNAKEHYVYLSTSEITPFEVHVYDGNNTPFPGSPFIISNTNPIEIHIGSNTESLGTKLFVTESELNEPIACLLYTSDAADD